MPPFDPSGFILGAAGFGILTIIGGIVFLALCAWVGYWFLRLVIRHGVQDAMRWRAEGMPSRAERRYRQSLALHQQRVRESAAARASAPEVPGPSIRNW